MLPNLFSKSFIDYHVIHHCNEKERKDFDEITEINISYNHNNSCFHICDSTSHHCFTECEWELANWEEAEPTEHLYVLCALSFLFVFLVLYNFFENKVNFQT